MSELFAAFRQHLIWGLMLWVLIFTAFTALFANGRLIAFAVGLARVLGSIFATPFRFIRRAVTSVLGHTPDAEARYRASDQYLLNKGMLVLQAIVIVLAVGVLSAAVVVTWDVLVPPSEVRRAARDYARDVESQRKKSAEAQATIASLDTEWSQKEQAAVAAYRQARETSVNDAQKAMANIESSAQTQGGPNVVSTLQNLKETVAGRSMDSPDDIQRMKRRLDSIVYQNWYWVGNWQGTLNQWNEHWQNKAYAEYQLASLSLAELRNAEQPAYAEAAGTRDREAEVLAEMEAALVRHQEAASLKWKAAFFRALRSFITFLLFVWVAGALIEGGWMAIHVADDVRRIRESVQPEPVATSVAPDAYIPIRDNTAERPLTMTPPGPAEA